MNGKEVERSAVLPMPISKVFKTGNNEGSTVSVQVLRTNSGKVPDVNQESQSLRPSPISPGQLENLRRNDVSAWEDFAAKAARLRPLLIFMGIRESDVDDILQDALIKFYKHINKIKNTRPWAYFVVTVKNTATSLGRTYQVHNKHLTSLSHQAFMEDEELFEDFTEIVPLPGKSLEEKSAARMQVAALLESSREDRLLLFLSVQGATYKEIAESTGFTESAVRARIHRERDWVRNEMILEQLSELSPDMQKQRIDKFSKDEARELAVQLQKMQEERKFKSLNVVIVSVTKELKTNRAG